MSVHEISINANVDFEKGEESKPCRTIGCYIRCKYGIDASKNKARFREKNYK